MIAGVVRVIRALDRRGGLASERGQRAYARATPLVRGLHRAVVADVAQRVDGRSATILDIGAGPGDLVRGLRTTLPGATVAGVEPAAGMRAIAAERGTELLDGRSEALPVADGSVDLVVSTLASHHWDDPVAAFREIARVLRPDGEAWIDDVRFAGYGLDEARAFATAAGLAQGAIHRRVLDVRVFGIRLFARLVIAPSPGSTAT